MNGFWLTRSVSLRLSGALLLCHCTDENRDHLILPSLHTRQTVSYCDVRNIGRHRGSLGDWRHCDSLSVQPSCRSLGHYHTRDEVHQLCQLSLRELSSKRSDRHSALLSTYSTSLASCRLYFRDASFVYTQTEAQNVYETSADFTPPSPEHTPQTTNYPLCPFRGRHRVCGH